jgi:hypothetical protein
MSSDHSTSSSSSDVVTAFIESIITDLTPSTPPTNDNVPIEETPSNSMSPDMPPLEEIVMLRMESPDYMPHTPTASEIDRMMTPLPMNPGPPPPRQHPGDPFVLFEPLNPRHYPLNIQLPEGDTVNAQYVAYYEMAENPYMTGTMGYGRPIYGAPLMAREDVAGPPDEDSTHVSFEPMHIFYNQINEAIRTIGDPGLTGDITRYRRIAKRRAEL